MAAIASFERRILIDRFGKLLWTLRRQPSHAAFYLAGIALPPHERTWLGVYFSDTKENNVLASRGTSKSFTHASMAAPLKAVLYKDLAILTLSASGFRGGKELFKDADRLFQGQLKSQELPGNYLMASLARSNRVISKDPSLWTIELRSHSRHSTAPTNNPEQLRGLRANEVQIDERAFIDPEIPQKIIRPMLAVGMDFRRAAQGGDRNKIFQVSTIDFTIRDWWNELQVADRDMRNEFAAAKARKEGDWAEYDRLMNDNQGRLRTLSFSYTRVDYTDLLIPEYINTIDGLKRYRIEYPREKGIKREDVLRYDEHDKISYWYTYPVDKKGLEEPKNAGTVDTEIWNAEQRNVPIMGSGNVFPADLIQRVAERPIPTKKKRRDDDGDTDEEFYAPLLYTCGDPCVLGCDVARESDDISFTVIRLGELAEAEFSPFEEKVDGQGRTILGHTDWNHICWAESMSKKEASEVAAKIRDLKKRYNIIYTLTTAQGAGIGGIALDQKGGGSAVRDDLGNPKPPVIDGMADPDWKWDDVQKLYDPEDENGFGHYAAFSDPEKYWSGLRLINAQQQDNVDWTYSIRGLMQAKKLYIAFWMPPSRWAWDKGLLMPNGDADKHNPEYVKWEAGYNGIRRLKSQLIRLQTKVTETGVIRFVMPGDRSKDEGKKDFWAAMIYAGSLARLHLNARTNMDQQAPMVEPLIVSQQGGPMDVPNFLGDELQHRKGWV
jgi:hypothetical protein